MSDEQRDMIQRGMAAGAAQSARRTTDADTIQDLREQLADAYDALGEVSTILQQRGQDGWEARLLAIVNKALKGKVTR